MKKKKQITKAVDKQSCIQNEGDSSSQDADSDELDSSQSDSVFVGDETSQLESVFGDETIQFNNDDKYEDDDDEYDDEDESEYEDDDCSNTRTPSGFIESMVDNSSSDAEKSVVTRSQKRRITIDEKENQVSLEV